MERFLIIGGGIAGTEAALAVRAARGDALVTLVAEEPRPFYVRPLLADTVAGRVPEASVWRDFAAEAHARRITVVTGRRATALDRTEGSVTLSDGQIRAYDRLLVATGVRPRLPDIPGLGLKGVTTFSTHADAVRIREWAETAERAVVVGRGLQGVELARALKLSGLAVALLVPDESPWFPALYRVKGEFIEAALARHGVEVVAADSPVELLARPGHEHVHTVRTRQEQELPADLVGFASDQRARVEFLVGAGVALADGVVTDVQLRSSDPRIFAAGDVAQVEVDGRRLPLGYGWLRARAHGVVAGRNMAGDTIAVETDDEDEAQALYGRGLLARWE